MRDGVGLMVAARHWAVWWLSQRASRVVQKPLYVVGFAAASWRHVVVVVNPWRDPWSASHWLTDWLCDWVSELYVMWCDVASSSSSSTRRALHCVFCSWTQSLHAHHNQTIVKPDKCSVTRLKFITNQCTPIISIFCRKNNLRVST